VVTNATLIKRARTIVNAFFIILSPPFYLI